MSHYGATNPPNSGWNAPAFSSPNNQPYPPPNNQPYPPQNNQPFPPQNNQPFPPQNNQPFPSPSGQPYPSPNPPPYQQGGYPAGGQALPPSNPSAPDLDNLPPGVNIDMLPNQPDPSQPFQPSKPMEPVPGYSGIGFDHNPLNPPPPINDPGKYFPKDRPELKGVAVITEAEAREALLELSKSHCCWGNKTATSMSVQDMKSSSAFQYCLETFCEMRSTAWTRTPYSGQMLDGPQNGQAPGPWDMPAQCPALFKTDRVVVEVPHTASARPCDYCQSYGWVRCTNCHGRGLRNCISCHGFGRRFNDQCVFCHGLGTDRCITCHGNGRIKCKLCQGHRSLKWFIQLTIDWINHSSDHIADSTDLPNEMLRNVRGDIALQEENVQVFPVTNCPEVSINQASNTLINQHATAFPSERRIMQRQTIRVIPVTQATGDHKGDKFPFFVYGLEKKAHTTEYPQTCCCGCTLL